MTQNTLTPDIVLDQAIALAQKSSWQSFSLLELALLLDCSLTEINQFYRSKDDIAEALFDRADKAMLNLSTSETYRQLTEDEKLSECILVWLEALTPYKSLVREILTYKLEPGHFHLQAHGVTRISRTVQWFLEVSDRKNTGLKRIADEVAVTSVYLISFSSFLFDNSEQHNKTRARLKSLINKIVQSQKMFPS